MQFHAEPVASTMLLQALAARAPTNPFVTPSYVAARATLGERPWILGLQQEGRWAVACLAFLSPGWLARSAEVPSLPLLTSDNSAFWQGILSFARRHQVWELFLESFASPSLELPPLPGERARHARREYLIDLSNGDPWQTLSSHHRRNVTRAKKEGLALRRTANAEACETHARLISASLSRRAARGEAVVTVAEYTDFHRALIGSGAAELFQAVRGNEVISSVLVLKAAQGAYYQSAGTLQDGMACGASHFLIHETCQVLKAENVHLFNLGGAGPHELGLQRFKAGFGARELRLEAVQLVLASGIKRTLRTAARLLLPQKAFHALF